MTGVTYADIFFVISSIGTIIFTLLVGVILYQIIKILHVTRRLLERIDAGSEQLAEDLHHVRAVIAQGGILSRVVGFFLPTRTTKPRAKRKTRKNE